MHWLWITVSKSHPDWLTYKTKNRWLSVDSHFRNAAVTVSISLLPIKAADTLVMDNSEQIAFQLPYLQNTELLTLSIRMWLLPCRGLFCLYWWPICWLWIKASKSLPNEVAYKSKNHWRSVDAHVENWAVTASLSLSAIKAANTLVMHNCEQIASQLTYLQNQNHCHSVESHFQHWAVSVLLVLLPIKAANTCVMNNSMLLAFQFTYLKDQKSLTLHSHSP